MSEPLREADLPRLSPRPGAMLRRARPLVERARHIAARERALRQAIHDEYAALRADLVKRELDKIPVARLREASDGRLRTAPLEEAGFSSVGHVHGRPHQELDQLPGMGEKSSRQAAAAAEPVAAAVAESPKERIDLAPRNDAATRLLRHLHRLVEVDTAAPSARRHAVDIARAMPDVLLRAKPTRS